MIDIVVISNQMIKLFLIICVGFMLYRIKLIDEEFRHKLTKLLLNVTMPALMLSSVMKEENSHDMGRVLEMFGLSIVIFAIALPFISMIIVKILPISKKQQGLYMFMNSFSNVGFMGFPIIHAVFGEGAMLDAAIVNLIFNLAVFTFGITMINYGTEQKDKFNIKKLLTPGIFSSVIAIIIYFSGITFPQVLSDTCSMIGEITSPIAMIIMGATLGRMDIKAVFSEWKVYPFTAIKQILIPILFWYVLKLFITDEYILGFMMIMLSMPVANTAVLFATEYKNDENLAAKTVFITTLMSLISIPFIMYVFFT